MRPRTQEELWLHRALQGLQIETKLKIGFLLKIMFEIHACSFFLYKHLFIYLKRRLFPLLVHFPSGCNGQVEARNLELHLDLPHG